MDALSASNSLKLQSCKGGSLIRWRKFSKLNVVASTTTIRDSAVVISSLASNGNVQLLGRSNYPKPMFQEVSTRSKEWVKGPRKTMDDGELQKEIGSLVEKLERVVERIREIEVNKFLASGRKEVASDDDLVAAEKMSEEIAAKFLEKPVRYLRSGDGNLEEKMNDVKLLVGMMEKSCSAT